VTSTAADRITYVGHATTLVRLGGVRVLTDPVLRDRVLFLRRQPPPPDWDLVSSPDLVLVSHAHHDHLDVHSLRQVAGGSEVLAPRGAGRIVERAGVGPVSEMDAGESAEAAGLTVRAVPADHEGARLRFSRAIPALGYMIAAGGGSPSVYFAGDTDLFEGMRELRGNVDLALIPVAGWGPKVGAGHLDPERAARAVELIRPRLAIPIHWGTLAAPLRRIPDLGAPPREFAELVARRTPETRVVVLEPGESAPLALG
jgi:L-ascorbate metabolism protein UlaG (beta-lactamase superfamily)